ncbi:SDR family NAD(P)-dependent oxidoreductase, partial [Vibrio parahaemolyticus]
TARDLEAVEQAIFEAGGQATIAPVDLAEPEAISRLAVAIAGRWDALDILVINAAVLPVLTPVWQIEPRDLNRALTLNVAATQALIAG